MMQAGAVLGPIERSTAAKPTPGPITPVHDLNMPYTEEYETPTAEMLFPPVSFDPHRNYKFNQCCLLLMLFYELKLLDC